MKKFFCFALAVAFLLSCLLAIGCSISSNKVLSYANETFVEPVEPVGFYRLDSIALLEDGHVSAAGVGAEWEERTLTENFATVVVKDDGTLFCSGALQGNANWNVDDKGSFFATGSMSEGEITFSGIDSSGLLFLEISREDGSSLTLCFVK